MNRDALALASAVLTGVCVIPYLRDMRRGVTRPQRTSWFVFAALSVIAAVSQFLAGSPAGAWLALGSATGFTAVFVGSWWYGEGGFAMVDRVVVVIAAAGVAVSLVAAAPVVATAAVVVAELLAISLTVGKTIRDPGSETCATWAIDAVAGLVAIAAIGTVRVEEWLYPVHHAVVNAVVVVVILRGRAAARRPSELRQLV